MSSIPNIYNYSNQEDHKRMQSQQSQPQLYRKIMEQNKNNRELGDGTFSKVYKYIQGSNTYAVKIITKSNFEREEDLKKLMAYEINSLQKVKGKTCNIVNLYQWSQDYKYVYLFFQYCANGTLWDLVQKDRGLEEKKAIHYLFQIVKALLVLHQEKIIHRDIKPNNIFLTQDNVIKVGDFGFAKQCYNNIRVSAVGTLEFQSPQILICNSNDGPNSLRFGQVTDKLDIWSLGVTFFYMIFNKLPWPSKKSNKSRNEQQLELIKQTPIQKLLQQQKKQISQATKKFIIGCLQYKQKDRLSYALIREHEIFSTAFIAQKIISSQRQIIKKNKWDIEKILRQIGLKKQWNQQLNVKELEIVLKKINGSIDYPKIMAIYQTYQDRLSLQLLGELLGESKKMETRDQNVNLGGVMQDGNAKMKSKNQDFQFKIIIKESYIQVSPDKPSNKTPKFQKRKHII